MLYLLSILIPLVTGALLPFLKIDKTAKRVTYVMGTLVLTALSAAGAMLSGKPFTFAAFGKGLDLTLFSDGIGCFFAVLVLTAWILVSIYTFRYITHEGNDNRFFAFLLLTLGGLLGVCFARNLVTLYLFFELATLASMPMVLHAQSKESIAAALKYLFYSVGGAFLGLLGLFAIYFYSPSHDFVFGGTVDAASLGDNKNLFFVMVFLAVVGFATKAGMFPMHNWLPTAHPVAPASASALLSGIITKAGVIAVIRVIYYSVGTELLAGSWVQYAWIALALVTVFMGSMMAYHEKVLKKRLAYSTVSNLSYILVGLFTLCPQGLLGALLHVVAHASAKTALFLVAGSIIFETHKTRVDELRGIGKEMPVTMWCFTLASLSLIGIPPLSGFVSKWHLAGAALESVPGFVGVLIPVVLLISALLTAGYLLSVVVEGFFPGKDYDYTTPHTEAKAVMVVPVVCLTAITLCAGIFAQPLTGVISSLLGL